jgi:hypothetical protein
MNIIIYIQNLIVSLLSNLGLSERITTALANFSLVAIASGLVIAFPRITLFAVLLLLGLLFFNRWHLRQPSTSATRGGDRHKRRLAMTQKRNFDPKKDVPTRVVSLAKAATKGVVKEAGKISGGVLSELFKIMTLQKWENASARCGAARALRSHDRRFLHSAWGRLEPEFRTSLATEKFRCLLVRAGVELALPWKRN